MDLRSFMWGTMAGIVMFILALAIVSQIAHVKWQPVLTQTVD